MAIVSADKIFVDVNDEINFVVEKILDSTKERVILVAPQNSLFLSSLVSMKILAKQIAKSKKQVVLVTEDDFGLQLAAQAGVTATNKVSGVTPEMWESAQLTKEKSKVATEEKKVKLLKERGIIHEHVEEKEVNLGNLAKSDAEEEPEMQMTKDIEEAESAVIHEQIEEPEQVEEPEMEVEAQEPEVEEKKEPEVKGAIQRKRREPKLVEVGAFQIYAGGDIMELSRPMVNLNEEEPEVAVERRERLIQPAKKATSFTGRDWTNYTGDSSGKPRFSLANIFNRNKEEDIVPPRGEDAVDDKKRKRKLMFIALGLIGGALLIVIYLLAFKFNYIEVKVSLKTAEIPVEQQVTADPAVQAINTTDLIIPGKVIEDTVGISDGPFDSTGTGATGEKASGFIEIWNLTSAKPIKIAKGTIAQNIANGLKYVIQQDVTVPAADPNNPGNVNTFGIAKDVEITAEKFGEDYNITDPPGEKVDFKIGDMNTTDIKGKRFNKIEGGTTEAFVSPSKDDVEKRKKSMTETLTKQGSDKLQLLVPAGYRILTDSIVFKQTDLHTTPAVGEKGDNFNITIEGKVSAIAVSEDDLKAVITELVKRGQDPTLGSDIQVTTLDDAAITNVKRTKDKVSFTITSKGSLQSVVTESDIKDQIAGKSPNEVESILLKIDQIESVKTNFTPTFLPDFLKRVPTDHDRIRVIFENN